MLRKMTGTEREREGERDKFQNNKEAVTEKPLLRERCRAFEMRCSYVGEAMTEKKSFISALLSINGCTNETQRILE